MQVISSKTDLFDRFTVVVDHGADPFDLDRFLDALDRLVERRLAARQQNVLRPATRSSAWPSSDSTAIPHPKYKKGEGPRAPPNDPSLLP